MGATNFVAEGCGKTLEEAFGRAVEDALWEHGHGGYTGTIAEKGGVLGFDLPPRIMPDKVISMLLEAVTPEDAAAREQDRKRYGMKADRSSITRQRRAWEWLELHFGSGDARRMIAAFNDKWGPAVAFPAKGKTLERYVNWHGYPRRGHKVWVFAGWASC